VAQQDGVTVAVLAFDVAGDGSSTSGQYATPTSSDPGPRPDARRSRPACDGQTVGQCGPGPQTTDASAGSNLADA
jgi:hypothetical protein